jgi:4-hydroxybenzoate polyprenyltransferase
MLTFFYTKHVKPRTWLKTLVCASLISFSPFTSGAAALKVASEVGQGPWGTIGILAVPNLWRLVATLFFGVSGREIMMDILDTNDDKLSGVRTIPVKYGRKFASTVAMVCYMLSGIWVIGGPLSQLVTQIGDLPMVWSTMRTILFTNSEGITRRLLFATFGSLMLMGRGLQIFKTKGEDGYIIEKTVNEAQIAMVLSMVSFV